MATNITELRPWNLVAPWYRWDRQLKEEGREPRRTRPVFQKFDEPDFVKDFVANPQHSLKFKDDVDRVFNVKLTNVPKPGAGNTFAGRFTRLYAPFTKKASDRTANDATLVPTGIRKIFMPTHKRYYLVVAELHCDAPGFPTTTPDQVCQAAFVVRRRSFDYPHGARKEAAAQIKKIVAIEAEIADLEQTSPAKGLVAKRRAQAVAKMIADGVYEAKKAEARSRLLAARLELRQWKDDNGVVQVLEGWFPGQFKNIGSWQIVEETPQKLLESTFPVYPLFPDPSIPDHAARGKNIYFGVVPTTSLETDTKGTAQFDDDSLYEVRCFVRRHKPDCPRTDKVPDCPGELFWSEPTESYMLAAPSDLIGTSQRPITIQVPNLQELAAHAAAFPLSQLLPAKVKKPQSLNFSVNDGKPEGGSVGGNFQICFFAIPLITIVATFVFELFLPILVFLFGLFFLLQLKFCIPPSFQIDAGLKLQLDAIPPSVDVDVDLSASVALDLNEKMVLNIAGDAGITASADVNHLREYSNIPLLPMARAMSVTADLNENKGDAGLDLTGSLEFEAEVKVS